MNPNRFLVALLALMAGLIFGCANMSSGNASQSTGPLKAVMVGGGNGGGTTIYLPSDDGKDVVTLSDGKGPTCQDCRVAAMKYFQTGQLEAKCPTCGGTRTVFALPSSGQGHN